MLIPKAGDSRTMHGTWIPHQSLGDHSVDSLGTDMPSGLASGEGDPLRRTGMGGVRDFLGDLNKGQ